MLDKYIADHESRLSDLKFIETAPAVVVHDVVLTLIRLYKQKIKELTQSQD